MRVTVNVLVVGRASSDPYGGAPLATVDVHLPESPQVGDALPPLVAGHGELTVRTRRWVEAGASLALTVTAECREVTP